MNTSENLVVFDILRDLCAILFIQFKSKKALDSKDISRDG